MTLLSAALLVAFVLSVNSAGLRDNPIVGDSEPLYLDGLQWTATSDDKTSIPASVPGDLISDLYNAKKIQDPLYETVWIDNSAMWDKHVWNYSVTFSYQSTSASEVYLVFDGIKMGAYIILNGQHVGIAKNQFLRYSFPVKHLLKAGNNDLIVSFPSTSEIDVEGRFMACTGGWDWAPYSNTKDQHGANTLTKGIWKSVYLVPVTTAAIAHVVPLVHYDGDYPTAPLTDTNHATFTVNITVHFIAPADVQGTLMVSASFGSISRPVSLKGGTDNVQSVTLSAPTNVKLWWPAGMGQQNLYPLIVSFKPSTGNLVTATRRIGFRVFALVTANDTNPDSLKGVDGSGTLTMRFRVNGANIWSRGGNMIPMEEYEGRANADAFNYLLNSAVEGNMNTLRIWGGGIFLYDVFYDKSDELGLLMYHDMMYAQGGHSPTATPNQDQEIRHQVRRLSHHPSIAIWDACNECGGQGIYATFVSTTIAEEDKSRPVWPSCPSQGWDSGVDRLYGLPNGKPLVTRGNGANFETHGPYQHGSGWPAVNGDSKLEPFPPNTPPYFEVNRNTGPHQPGVYASEFGCVAWSSYESLAPTLSPAHYSLHSPPMYQRNYPCDNIIEVYWGPQQYPVGEVSFKRQLYQCLLGSALELKSDIEARRAGNEWGTVIWQLNEVWPTGGWGTIEYGTPVSGQALGGRWKPVHYYLRNSVFADVMATCGNKANCYVKNDGITPFAGKVTVSLVHFDTGKVDVVRSVDVNLAAGGGVMYPFCLEDGSGNNCATWDDINKKYGCTQGGVNCILTTSVADGTTEVSTNLVALQIPGNMNLPQAKVRFTASQNSSTSATVELTTDKVAAFVILTTEASGRFSDNAFLLLPGTKSISFTAWGAFNFDKFSTTLRVEHAQMYK